jgi:tetratricopeptide (TPR) repeat protein
VPGAEFTNLASQLMEAMGQALASVRQVPEGVLVQTTDGFLFALLEDPTQVSLGFIQRLGLELGGEGRRLLVLTRGRLPLALTAEVTRRGGAVVDSGRFVELVRGLGLGPLIGEEPRGSGSPTSNRLLPSARQLDEIMERARSWSAWGVPALALRFYRQASTMKPEFLPARNGIAEALTEMGLTKEAARGFEEVLAIAPGNLEARLGQASILGREGRTVEEIAAYRTLLSEEPSRLVVRARLVAALIAESAWPAARTEIEGMLERTPDDPTFRYLHSVALEHTHEARAAITERERAIALGLSYDREKALAAQLGLPAPALRPDLVPPPSPAAAEPAPEEAPLPSVLPLRAPAQAPAPPTSRSRKPAAAKTPTARARARVRKAPAKGAARATDRPPKPAPPGPARATRKPKKGRAR